MFSYLQAKINKELSNSKIFNFENKQNGGGGGGSKKLHQRTGSPLNRVKNSASMKARSLMNLHNNEAGRRVST